MKKLAKAYMASGLLCCIGIAPFSGEIYLDSTHIGNERTVIDMAISAL